MRLWALSCLVLAGAAQAADVGWPQAVEAARQRAEQPYQPTPVTLPDWLQQLDPQAWQEIRFDPSAALWAGQGLPFSVRVMRSFPPDPLCIVHDGFPSKKPRPAVTNFEHSGHKKQ